MTEHNLAPIELTDDELLAVSGGSGSIRTSASISQRVHQDVAIAQLGGNVLVGGGNGATTVTNVSASMRIAVTPGGTTYSWITSRSIAAIDLSWIQSPGPA
jgi:hypothetical protein